MSYKFKTPPLTKEQTKYRDKLLRTFVEKKMSLDSIEKISSRLREKNQEEKEKIAAQIIYEITQK